MKTKYVRCDNFISSDVEFFVERGVPEQFARVLSSRGVTKESFDEFVSPTFHDPFEMTNMSQVVDVVREVVEFGGSILIYGDYDADGLSAAALLSLFFTHNGVSNKVLIPTRDEGYGMHVDKILKAFEADWYDLVLTVDCGISNVDEVASLKEQFGDEVTIVVTDHHEIPEILPDCLCLNPKLGYPFPYLSGSGVAYKLVEALAGRQVAEKYADLAIIGTIGDIMPLQDENRSLVKLGLARFEHRGLKKLAELSKCSKQVSATDVAMRIAPKINAAGRVGDPYAALELLLCAERVPQGVAEKLLSLNEERRKMLDETVQSAECMIDANAVRRDKLVFLIGEDWKHGILGIVASKFKERFGLPAVVATRDGDFYVGSARCIDGINLHTLFANASHLLEKFGGHKSSVGFSVSAANVQALKDNLTKQLAQFPDDTFESNVVYDVELDGSISVRDAYEFCKTLEPCLPSDAVKFFVSDHVVRANAFGKDGNHVSATLSSGLEVKGFFNFAPYVEPLKTGADVEAVCLLDVDAFSGDVVGNLQELTLKNSVKFEPLYVENFVQNIQTVQAAAKRMIDEVQTRKLLSERGTLAVFDCYDHFTTASRQFDFDGYALEFFYEKRPSENCVVISPCAEFDYTPYRNVVVFGFSGGVSRAYSDGAVYADISLGSGFLDGLTIDRSICVAVFSALRTKTRFDSVDGCFSKYLVGKCSRAQFVLALKVFEELQLLKVEGSYDVQFAVGKKVELDNSRLFSAFCVKSDYKEDD